ncbi:hypothetical protein U8527_09685 [Kordia algicida OT-1]|uniref:Macroglobulin domain-containing protein n=1 Tax=Kordia algicida OT-1 TaxID=391587 RepID=A9DV51_9FLAO|nr:hypothetical protein [Kordia algicida]EDP96375.1 hypothetical protein KAOT1_03162 [Kordia algicida OT-1]
MKYITAVFLLISLNATSQTLDSISNYRLVTQFENLATEQLKENIYIHTDKDIYEPGEDLWFKAYLLNGNNVKLSRETNIIFVELYKLENDDPFMIVQEKYEAANGFANGYLFLAEILEDGDYELRIHTKNTLESSSKTIRSIKRIQIKTSIIPKILIDSEFSQKTYNRKQQISLNVSVFSRSRVPYKNTSLIATLYAGTKKLDRIRTETDANGEAKISFPVDKNKNATTIKLRVKEGKNNAEHNVEIPFRNISKIQFGMYPEGGNLVNNLPNTVAFKAVNHYGKPIKIKGELYENGKKVNTFETVHYGMGKFSFTPKQDRSYTVKIVRPKLDSIFKIDNIKNTGIKLQVDRQTKNHVHFSITKTANVSEQKVYIRAQSRGLVYWMATASLSKQRVRFKLPLDKLPQGIAEVTLFDQNMFPIAERLVYANLDQKLQVSLSEISKSSFRQKDKVTLKFKVKDQNQNPAIANLSLSVCDHLYVDKENDYAIMPHYYLFSELKGHIYDARYYFDSKKKNRERYLDLLLLTQGWRTYVWNETLFEEPKKRLTFSPNIQGKLYQKTESGTLQNASNAEIRVILPKSVRSSKVDVGGNFSFTPSILKIAQGHQLTFFPMDTEKMILILEDPFEEIESLTKNKMLIFPETDVRKAAKKQSSYDAKFSFTETNYLEEVNLTTYKNRNKNRGKAYNYQGSSSDYVCFEYNILNCVNHKAGPKPEFGETYRLNDGSLVTYMGAKGDESTENRGFVSTKGFYPEKEFYSPLYVDATEKAFPDNRKTLFWAPNLVSDENGEITVSFYTSDVQTTFLGKLEGTNGNGLLGGTVFQFDVN